MFDNKTNINEYSNQPYSSANTHLFARIHCRSLVCRAPAIAHETMAHSEQHNTAAKMEFSISCHSSRKIFNSFARRLPIKYDNVTESIQM